MQGQAQTPGLLWSTNVGANLFAVDEQTNIYASVGGAVIKLNANGVPLQTNSICPIPGIAQRDALGNFYFAGNFDGTQNFGGITLVGGWTNWPNPGHWTPGSPTHYVAKYASNGSLLGVTSFGEQAGINMRVTDFILDLSDGLLVGHLGVSGVPKVTRLSSTVTIQWTKSVNLSGFQQTIRLGGLTSSNLCFAYNDSAFINASRLDYNGNVTGGGILPWFQLNPTSNEATNTRLVVDDQVQLFLVGNTNGQQVLCKFNPSGTLLWAKPIPTGVQWTLARDVTASIYCGALDGALVKYDVNGNDIWTANYQSNKVIRMLVDAAGNRFLNFANGGIARLGSDAAPQLPVIQVGPQNQIRPLGSNATFSVTASGSPALYYQWRKDGTNLIGATFMNYSIVGITTNHVGAYDVVVTNLYGSVTSTPPAALLVSPSLLSPFTGQVGIWGHEATLSVSAYGSGTLSYQWYKSGQLVSGATNSTLVFPSLQINDAGLYSVIVTSQYGSVTNTPAQLVVNPANISLGLYAGITIEGTAGYTYGIEYTTNLQDTNAWQSLTNITLTQPVEIWVDTSVNVPTSAKRYYRVTNQ